MTGLQRAIANAEARYRAKDCEAAAASLDALSHGDAPPPDVLGLCRLRQGAPAAGAYLAAGLPDRATAAFADATRRAPRFAEAWRNLGVARENGALPADLPTLNALSTC